ncbi:hypothetical protein PLICRDRAFT_171954 [Plicaturopsis crispa FD-325 SS-3]|nr:hypothetical protein PLICRDRAFT_171954 [Plicaturopsis crispa FD-325 SS-3]
MLPSTSVTTPRGWAHLYPESASELTDPHGGDRPPSMPKPRQSSPRLVNASPPPPRAVEARAPAHRHRCRADAEQVHPPLRTPPARIRISADLSPPHVELHAEFGRPSR